MTKKIIRVLTGFICVGALLVTGLAPKGMMINANATPEIPSADSYDELQVLAPADLDTASSYEVNFSTGLAEGSNQDTVSIENAFGVETQDSMTETIQEIEETELYTVSDLEADTAVVYAPYARHRIIVYTDEALTETYDAIKATYFDKDGGYRLCYESDAATKAAFDALSEIYGSDSVILDMAISISSETKGWGTSYMNLDGGNLPDDIRQSVKPITVAVLDTGIMETHEVFSEHNISEQSVSFLSDDDLLDDENGHGTAVAGIIAESTAVDTDLLIIKIADENGESSLDYMMNGLAYAAEQGADVANVSMNAYFGDTTLSQERIEETISVLEENMQSITEGGMIVCVSAGNDARDIGSSYNYPAMSEYTLCTGSINEAGVRSDFSSFGGTLDFVAPGQDVVCASINGTDSWKTASGTSFASPYLAAAAALVKSELSEADCGKAEEVLSAVSVDLGDEGRDIYYGNGVPVFSDAEEGEEADEDISLPDGWEEDDPLSMKLYMQMNGTDSESEAESEPSLNTSSVSATTYWLGHPNVSKFSANSYNSSTKKYSGSKYITVYHDTRNMTDNQAIPVIDVSYYNLTVDWNAVKASGVQAVMIRCGYRGYASTGKIVEDVKFEENIKAAKKAGLKVGVYFFSQAINMSESVAEADAAIGWIEETGQTLDLPLCIDIEYTPSNGRLANASLSKAALTNIASAFCYHVKVAGYTPMVYASSSFLTNHLNASTLTGKGYQIWMARYGASSSYTTSAYPNTNYYQSAVPMWQCSSEAAVNGISTATDLNYWYVKSPIVQENGAYYYYKDGVIQKWLFTDEDGNYYYGGSDGKLAINKLIKFNDSKYGWMYFGSDGKAKKWLITLSNGDRYYVGSDAKLVRNKLIKFNNSQYGWMYFGSDGKAVKWLFTTSNGNRYYGGSDGKLAQNKLIKFNNESLGWLYFGSDATVQKAKIVKVGGNYYYATRVDGRIMRTKGWIILNGNKYYAETGGALVTNTWKKIGSKWYHFTATGINDKTSSTAP